MVKDSDQKSSAQGPLAKVTGNASISLLNATSRMLDQAETVEDFVDVRKQAEAIRCVARKLQAQFEILSEAACVTIRAEHRLGQLLAELPLAKGAPGNQRTGKVDRLPRVTGPLFLKELGISKRVSQRAQQIATIPEKQLEKWLAQQCAKGKEPSLRGAMRFARTLQTPRSTNGTGILAKRKRHCRDPELNDPDDPRALLHDARKHLDIVAEQLKPLYEPPTRPLEEFELRAMKRYLQQLADTLAELDETLRAHSPCPVNQPPSGGGGSIPSRGFADQRRWCGRRSGIAACRAG